MADTIKGKLVIDTQVQIDSARKQLSDLQKYLDKLTIPSNLKDRFTTTFSSLNKEFSKLETRIQGSLKTKGDLSGIEKTTQAIERLYENLINLTTDPDIIRPLLFLRQREIIHFNRFKELYNIDNFVHHINNLHYLILLQHLKF